MTREFSRYFFLSVVSDTWRTCLEQMCRARRLNRTCAVDHMAMRSRLFGPLLALANH